MSESSNVFSVAAVLVSRDTEEAEARPYSRSNLLVFPAVSLSVSPPAPHARHLTLLHARSSQASDSGFTLVELLVSLTLLGMLSLVLFGGVHFGRSVWQATETKTAAVDRIRAFQASLATELSRTYPEIDEANGSVGAKVKFDGENDRVSFLTPSPNDSGMLVKTTVKPEVMGGTIHLVEARRPELARTSQETVVNTPLPAISSVRLSYFGSLKDNEAPDWHESWSSQTKLPDLVRMHVTFADRRVGWPDLIVRPRVEADVGCTFDPLARACSGR